jgi:hypothetical protein
MAKPCKEEKDLNERSDIEIAREAAAAAQTAPVVVSMIESGKYDAWPNVQGALNAVRMLRKEAATA